MLDSDFSYWNAMANRYWPAFYLIDRQGRLGRRPPESCTPDRREAMISRQQVKRALADG